MKISELIGMETKSISHTERLVSAAGAFVGIFILFFLTRGEDAGVVASMGATAVLLFAVPHSQLSQPWHLFAGHLVSALIGVTVAKLVPSMLFAAPLAVAISIGAMHYLRCIHPPGGATAFTAVAGGAQIHSLGYGFLFSPVLVNVLFIFMAAIAFNWFFPWRRYPSILVRAQMKAPLPKARYEPIAHEDFVYALSQIDSFIDISEQDLLRIYSIATGHHHEAVSTLFTAGEVGRHYSNGEEGENWTVLKIVDRNDDNLIYKKVAGNTRHAYGVMTAAEFSAWAKYEVQWVAGQWRQALDAGKT